MKNAIFILSFLALSLFSFAAKEKPAAGSFAHHCGEFHITPSADYYIYSKGKNYEAPEPYEFQMPFIGFDLGGQYMYRPVEVFAVSAGLGFRMQGSYYRHTVTIFDKKHVDYTSISHTGYLQMPIEFHLFKQMPNSTFEFATGPQFNFPVLRNSTSSSYNLNGDKLTTDKSKDKFTTKQMGDNAVLGWNILLGAEVNLADHADLFIGPQINFLNIAYFDKDINESRRDNGSNFDCSLGLKLGFRFHCEK